MEIKELMGHAVTRGASDLHLAVGRPPTLRIAGQLVGLDYDKLLPDDTRGFAEEILNEEQMLRFEDDGEIDLSYSEYGMGRFRVNIYRQRGSIGLAMRLIADTIPSIEQLGLPSVVSRLAEYPDGLVIVTGPTGSGKSTSLAAMIDKINRTRSAHIVTLEDPIEYLHQHRSCIINQREILSDTKTFVSGLRAALREDPEVILVGEMRDLETISTAVRAAETGHLVLTTLHTPSAAMTIDRIVDVFPPHQQEQVKVQLAGTLRAIVAQKLLTRSDGQGMVVATEILMATSAVKNLIREGKTHQIDSVIQTGTKFGMHTMESDLRRLSDQGLITAEQYTTHVRDILGVGRD